MRRGLFRYQTAPDVWFVCVGDEAGRRTHVFYELYLRYCVSPHFHTLPVLSVEEAGEADREPTPAARSFWWWLSAVLAPFGIIGGPIAIADLLSGWIEWRGPIPYILSYWERTISEPFARILHWLTDLAFPTLSIPGWVVDYVALGILLSSSGIRAASLMPIPVEMSINERSGESARDRFEVTAFSVMIGLFVVMPLMLLYVGLGATVWLVVWPLWFVGSVWVFLEPPYTGAFPTEYHAKARARKDDATKIQIFIRLLPFELFLLLWIANAFWHLDWSS